MADNFFTSGFKKAFGIKPAGGDGAYAQPFGSQSQIAESVLGLERLGELGSENIRPMGGDGNHTLQYTRKLLNQYGHPDTVVMTDHDNQLLTDEKSNKTIAIQAVAVVTDDKEKLVVVPSDTLAQFEKKSKLMKGVTAHEVGHIVGGMQVPPEGASEEVQKQIFHGNENRADKFGACIVGHRDMINSLRTMAKMDNIDPGTEDITHPSINARVANINALTKADCQAITGKKSGGKSPSH